MQRRLYQEWRIPEYWVVDIELAQVEIWTPEAHFPRVESSGNGSNGGTRTFQSGA